MKKDNKSSRRVVSNKIAAFVIIMLITPIAVAYGLHDFSSATQASFKASGTASTYYQLNIPQPGQKVVCIVFDDGWQSQYTTGVPIMNEYGFKASFAIITGYVDDQNPSYMSWKEIVSLANQGEDIESHTYSHLNLNIQSLSTIAFQLSQSQLDLKNHGINAKLFIYPDGGGAGNVTVENLVSSYYFVGRSINPGVLNMSKPFDRYDLPSYTMENTTTLPIFKSIVNQAGNSSVVIVYFHKIDNENVDTATTPQTFTAEMQYLYDNGFTVETMKQLFTASS
jgi:peptidoglycan/xylan/chitin deacetylase (PgdA/CDA1 family)